MGDDAPDLELLFERNVPDGSGDDVERAVQLIRFCGSLYRDLRGTYPELEWGPDLALALQELFERAKAELDLEGRVFAVASEESMSGWPPWGSELAVCAVARAARRGYVEDVLIACSIICNGYEYNPGDGLALVDGYLSVFPVVAAVSAPRSSLQNAAAFDIPSWYRWRSDQGSPRFHPELGAVRADADSDDRDWLLGSTDQFSRDLMLLIRATLGHTIRPAEARGDVRALLRLAATQTSKRDEDDEDEDDEDDGLSGLMNFVALAYSAARDAPLLLERSPEELSERLRWLDDWTEWSVPGQWPPFPSPRDPVLPPIPVVPEDLPVTDSAGNLVGSAVGLMAVDEYSRGDRESAGGWARVAAGMSVPAGHLVLAQLARGEGDNAGAAEWAMRGLALSRWPDQVDAELHSAMGAALLALGRTGEAIPEVARAVVQGSDTAQMAFANAARELSAGSQQTDPFAAFRLGHSLLEVEAVEAGLAWLELAARQGLPSALGSHGWCLLLRGEHERAVALFDEVINVCDEWVRTMRPSERELWGEQIANARSNDALHRLAVGGDTGTALAVWAGGAQVGHLDSKLFPAVLAWREGRQVEALDIIRSLNQDEVTEATRILAEGGSQATGWFQAWCQSGLDALAALDKPHS